MSVKQKIRGNHGKQTWNQHILVTPCLAWSFQQVTLEGLFDSCDWDDPGSYDITVSWHLFFTTIHGKEGMVESSAFFGGGKQGLAIDTV